MKKRINAAAAILSGLIFCGSLLGSGGQALAQSKDLTVVPNNQNPSIGLNISASSGTVRIGESIEFYLTTNRAGYVTLWDVGTSGRVTRIFPNQHSEDMYAVPGQRYGYGGQGSTYLFRVNGPVGFEDVYAVWTERPELQPKQFNYPNAQGLTRDLSVVEREPRQNWATAKVTFEITDGSPPPVYVPPPGAGLQSSGNIYLLAMGSDVGQLTKTNDDARAFVNTMRALGGNRLSVQMYENVTKRQFGDGMRWLKQSAGTQDLAIVFYSGHGSFVEDDNGDESDGFDEIFVPYDVQQYGPSSQYVIRDDQFAAWINDLRTDKVLTVIDACHSGGLQRSIFNGRVKMYSKGELGYTTRQVGGGDKNMNSVLDKVKGVVLAAAREKELAIESREGGVFVRALVRDLSRMRGNSFLDAFNNTRTAVEQQTGGRQHPVAVGDTGIISTIRIN